MVDSIQRSKKYNGDLPVSHRRQISPEKKHYSELSLFHFSKLLEKDFHGKKIKGLIFGNFGAQNYGDEAILTGQLKELSNVKNCHVQVVSRFPDNDKKMSPDRVGLLNVLGIIKAIYASDFLIIGGGGLFCKNDRGITGIFFQLYLIILFFILPMVLRKKIYVLGIGFYKNVNTFISALACSLLKKVEIVTVRDTYSYAFLSSKEVPVQLYKDHSFFMDLLPVKNILQNKFIKNKYDKKRLNVGIAVKRPKTPSETTKLLDVLTKFFAANADDTDFWIFSLDSHPGDSDRKFADDICISVKVNQNIRVHTLPEFSHPNRLFSAFQLMDYFIAMRFHGLLYAYRCNIPMYGLTYDQKCTSFLESIGKHAIEVNDVSADEMQRAFDGVKRKKE